MTILFICLLVFPIWAQQETTVAGQIIDKYDKAPIPSVNVYFKNTARGTTSNNEGYFLIRWWGEENTLVFSSVGYKPKEVKVKPGQPAYLDIELEEENTWLTDVFILPGVNPALEWMKKIRLMRKTNDITRYPDYQFENTEQDLILLARGERGIISKRLFDQFSKGNLSDSDSSLLIPLYMAESKYHQQNGKKEQLSKNIFNSAEVADKAVIQLLNGLNTDMNFYNNSVSVFGKSIISPLSAIGNTYYNFYLADSIPDAAGKQYEIHFISKNPKNLAFNGKFRFDSLSLAITYMEAVLPPKANINYIHNLSITQRFTSPGNHVWLKEDESTSLSMSYDLFKDSTLRKTELLVKRSNLINLSDPIDLSRNFASSTYNTITLEEKLNEVDNTPIIRTAKWIADAALTGYARAGVIDIGRLQQIIRLTDIEGIRLNVPLRTNEYLWKNISLGGYMGYGFRNEEIKYSVQAQFRLPTHKRRILGISYTDDYRRVDYNYNNFLVLESPWSIGDEDAINTIFSLTSGPKISPRKELAFSFSNDWTRNIESSLYVRFNQLLQNVNLPLILHGNEFSFFRQQALTLTTRFSLDEAKYEDHLQRIYIDNYKPVFYITMEGGRYEVGNNTGYYGKLLGSLKQNIRFDIGQWNYMVDAGIILGKVPYPLLEIPAGNEPGGITFSQFNRMKYMEFGSDLYAQFYNEFIFNGILFNYIPLIKHLNLREIVGIKAVFGTLSDRHEKVMDFPNLQFYPHYLREMKNPYLEASIGITNILRILTVQLNWRFTNLYDGIRPWSINAGLRIGF